ncbi:MAG: MFS transporter [Candidatus Acidiferrales bacterium]|jgi:MFS family permease
MSVFSWVSQYRWRIVFYLWIVCVLNYMDRSSVFVLYPVLQQKFSMSGTELGLIGSIFLWVYSLTSPLAGAIGDRISRKTVILGSLGLWSGVTLLTGMARSSHEFLLYRALMGVMEALYFPAALAMLSDYHGRATRSTAISIHQSGIYIGYFVGGSITAVLTGFGGWRLPFYLLGATGILGVWVFSKLVKEPLRGAAEELPASTLAPKRSFSQTLREFSRCPTLVALGIVHLIVLPAAWVVLSWAPYFIHNKFSLGLTEAAFKSTGALQFPSILGIIIGGILGDRLMRRGIRGRMFTLTAGLVLGSPFLVFAGWGHHLWMALVGLAGFGFFKALFDGNGASAIYDVVHPSNRAFAYGLINSLAGISSGFSVLLVGMLENRFGMSNLFASICLFYVVSAAITWYAAVHYLKGDVEKLRLTMRREQQGGETPIGAAVS